MKNLTIFVILIGLWSCKGQTNSSPNQTVKEITGKTTILTPSEIQISDSLNIDFQFRAYCYAYSSAKNAVKSNGEAHSDNLPKKIDSFFPRQGLYLVINQNEIGRFDNSILAHKLYLVNTTDSSIELDASDSRLNIVAEALNDKKEWIKISYVSGNRYHTVVLDKDEYWSFNVPILKGTTKTKLRYILKIDENKKISSNEIICFVNQGQFEAEYEEESSNKCNFE